MLPKERAESPSSSRASPPDAARFQELQVRESQLAEAVEAVASPGTQTTVPTLLSAAL